MSDVFGSARNYLKRCFKDERANYRYNKYESNREPINYIKKHNSPKLSDNEVKEIDHFWSRYHVKFKDYSWFQMFYSATGVHDPRFIPDPFMGMVIYPHYNDKTKSYAYADKNMCSVFLPDIRFPEVIGKRINGRYIDLEGNYYGEILSDEYCDILYETLKKTNTNTIIVKVAVGSYAGWGVKKYFIDSVESIKNALKEMDNKNLVIQKCIRQHLFFEQFNQSSVNIMRLITWRHGDKVDLLSSYIRFGLPGASTDVVHINGKELFNIILLNSSGEISDYSINQDYDSTLLSDIKLTTVPNWGKLLRTIKTAAINMNYFDVIGWDVTVDETGEPVCIEYNLRWPGTIVTQVAKGPFAGEHTESFLSFLEDPALAKNCIPHALYCE